MLETLLKVGLRRLALGRANGLKIDEGCLRIALRYGYDPVDVRMWRDYIEQLTYLGRDTHNPRILLPESLETEHRRMTELVNRKRRKEERAREAERRRERVRKGR